MLRRDSSPSRLPVPLRFVVAIAISAIPPAATAATSCAEATGAWACFEVPAALPPTPPTVAKPDGPAAITKMDLYMLPHSSQLLPLSTEMTCADTPVPNGCVNDFWAGDGVSGRTDTAPFTQVLDEQVYDGSDPATPPGASGVGPSTPLLATYSAVTGQGSDAAACDVDNPYPGRGSCDGSPAGAGGTGYACFRPDSYKVLVLYRYGPLADDPSVLTCPSIADVAAAARAADVKIAVEYPVDHTPPPPPYPEAWLAQYHELSAGTGLDMVRENPDPYGDWGMTTWLMLRDIQSSSPLDDVHAVVADDPSDGVDVTQFVGHLEADPAADASCLQGATLADRDGDGHDDSYVSIPSHSIPCWRLVAKSNAGAATPGDYRGTLEIYSDTALLHALPLEFIVPGAVPAAAIFTSGFESGTLCSWTAALGGGACV